MDTAHLIGCPACDAVWDVQEPAQQERAVCGRCGTVLITNLRGAGRRIVAMSLAVFVLVIAATVLPFLSIEATGLGNAVSLVQIATSFQSGPLVFLSVLSLLFIVGVPALRVALLVYVIGPMTLGRGPAAGARPAFRLAQALQPWSMTEIFAIGCAVALVKVADLARLEFGPAFWMFSLVAVIVVIADRYMCDWAVWKAIEART